MLASKEPITFAYFARHRNYVFGGMILGIGLILFLHHAALHHFHLAGVSGVWIAQFVLCCPFGLRTPQGRAWWTAFVSMLIGSAGFFYFDTRSIMGILCAVLVIALCGLVVCLRWNKP